MTTQITVTVPETDLSVFNPLKTQITELVATASAAKVTDAASQLSVANMSKQLRVLEKAFEAKRDELTRPLFTEQKRINAQVGEWMKPLLAGIKDLGTKLADFAKAELQRKAIEAQKAQEAADAKIKAIQDEAAERQLALAEFGVGPTKADEKVTAQAVKEVSKEFKATVRTLSIPSVAGVRMPWLYEVTDITQVRRELMTVDDPVIKRLIASGVRSEPGLRIYQDVRVAGGSASPGVTQ